jgi:large subunit ribosomal protein L7Ae
VLWPKYIRLQRQRAILKKRLKVPPSINQFARALDKNAASNLFRLLAAYRPESAEEKKKRLQAAAAAESKNTNVKASAKPLFVKYGLNHITHLVETKKAKLVVIAHDVEPIELVVWLPALCRKMNVPYVIVKGKSRLGHLVYKKTATAVAITETRKEDAPKLEQILDKARTQYNDNAADRKKWGGGVMGIKAQHVQRARERAIQKELASKGQA